MAGVAHIYTLGHPITGEIRYVGKAFDLKKRLYCHMHQRKNRSITKNSSWIISLKKRGLKPIIESFPEEDFQAWQEAERFWIETLRMYGCDLNNHESGGMGGKRHDLETKIKIGIKSKSHRHSPETKRKISIACKARMTDEEKERLRIKCSKFRHTEEMKVHLSTIKIGIPRPESVRHKLLQGSLKWKHKQGFIVPIKCCVCNRKIACKTVAEQDKWILSGIGHIHNKCKKIYEHNNRSNIPAANKKVQEGQQIYNSTISGTFECCL